MANCKFTLEFDGYWRQKNVVGVPSESGIYCVYACTFFKNRNTLGINELLYIGESDSVGTRIRGHELRLSWMDSLEEDQLSGTLCYNFAPMSSIEQGIDRKVVESVLIDANKPKLNVKKNNFSNEFIEVITRGQNALLLNYATSQPVL